MGNKEAKIVNEGIEHYLQWENEISEVDFKIKTYKDNNIIIWKYIKPFIQYAFERNKKKYNFNKYRKLIRKSIEKKNRKFKLSCRC